MNRLRAAGIGARVLKDWLGSGGKPVPTDHAERRAKVCLKPCPHNWKGDWWTRVEAKVAETIMEHRRTRLGLGLRVKREVDLHVCDVCLCPLANKIWVPFKHIEKHTPDDVWGDLPEFCWMLKERVE